MKNWMLCNSKSGSAGILPAVFGVPPDTASVKPSGGTPAGDGPEARAPRNFSEKLIFLRKSLLAVFRLQPASIQFVPTKMEVKISRIIREILGYYFLESNRFALPLFVFSALLIRSARAMLLFRPVSTKKYFHCALGKTQ